MAEDLEPREPHEAGVEEETPELAQIEAARLLANDARARLEAEGFSDEQIREWAETYVAKEGGTANVSEFVGWIERRES